MAKERSVFHVVRDWLAFRPGGLWSANYPRKPGATSGGYRSPSPGSQRPAYIPFRERDDLFNTQYYTRNTRLNAPRAPLPALRTENFDLMLPDPHQLALEGGSKGRKNPAVERYDPTMTRSAMTTSWGAMRNEVAKWLPVHLPHAWWQAEAKHDLLQDVKKRALENGHREPFGVPRKSLGNARYENLW